MLPHWKNKLHLKNEQELLIIILSCFNLQKTFGLTMQMVAWCIILLDALSVPIVLITKINLFKNDSSCLSVLYFLSVNFWDNESILKRLSIGTLTITATLLVSKPKNTRLFVETTDLASTNRTPNSWATCLNIS